MSLLNKYIMISTDEYYKLYHVVQKLEEEISGYIVEPLVISGKIYGGFEGVVPKEVLMVPELYGAESIYVFDDEASLRAWQKWLDEPSEESDKPKLSVVPFNKKSDPEQDSK